MFKKRYKQHVNGFSLIEMLVSLSLFTIVSVIVVGTILMLVNSNKKLQGEQQVMVGLSAVLDSMTREIRMGSFYYCAATLPTLQTMASDSSQNCNGASTLVFREGVRNLTSSQANDRIAYYRSSGGGVGVINRKISDRTAEVITPSNIDVLSMDFYVNGTDQLVDDNDVVQPSVTIVITARDLIEGSSGEIYTIQTTVVQRTLDI